MSKNSGRIIYLDGFAGPGIYEGTEIGSPIIAMKTADEHTLKRMIHEIVFLFIEKEKDRCAKLNEVIAERFPDLDDKLFYQIICAEFAPALEQILQDIESDNAKLAPTFAFLDPFGYSGFPLKLIARLMENKKCEVLITFMVKFINRFTIDLQEPILNELFATEDWKKVHELNDPEEKRRFLLELYKNQLIKVGGIRHVRSFEMVDKQNQTVYYLVFGTKHSLGLKVMKDAMWKVDKRGTYTFSDITDVNQKFLIDFQSPQWVSTAAKMVHNHFKGRTVSEKDVREYVITETNYRYQKKILKYLEKDCKPSKINNVNGRTRNDFSFPDGCEISFSD